MTHTLPTLEFLSQSRGSLVLRKTMLWKAIWRTQLLHKLQVALETKERQHHLLIYHTTALTVFTICEGCSSVFVALVMCQDISVPSYR